MDCGHGLLDDPRILGIARDLQPETATRGARCDRHPDTSRVGMRRPLDRPRPGWDTRAAALLAAGPTKPLWRSIVAPS